MSPTIAVSFTFGSFSRQRLKRIPASAAGLVRQSGAATTCLGTSPRFNLLLYSLLRLDALVLVKIQIPDPARKSKALAGARE